ncbi:MAG: NAD-dependent epimerase/dehydratase family protein [Jatrophihabitans sp.]|uniref:NAD-dependent epimerase/dehydratase family protein n=1 Tax=Jatrophihabitans sp. TaxID=1932789 RepID=UPI003F80ECE0
MSKYLVVGAGPVGRAVAAELVGRGDEVLVATRSGTEVAGARAIKLDASDAAALTEAAHGAVGIVNAVNPPYHRWELDWPPVADALLAAAERTGAVLAITGNLYGYGEVTAPMTESTPLASTGKKGRVRVRMWQDALAAHEAGRAKVFEVRGSDYLGGQNVLSTIIAPALRKGRTAFVPADLDAPHSWTDVRSMARTHVAVMDDPTAWGRAWHAPTAAPVSVRELTAIAAAQLGAKPKVRAMPYPVLWAAGLFVPMVKELRETQHQLRRPFILDSSETEHRFGLEPPAIEESVAYDLGTA